jgi:hypothetical protein
MLTPIQTKALEKVVLNAFGLTMNLDLTPQFVRDYHKLLQDAQKPPPPIDLLDKIKRLETEVERLERDQEKVERLLAESKKAAALNEALAKKISGELAATQGKLKQTHEELGPKEEALNQAKNALNLTRDALNQAQAEAARIRRELAEALQRERAAMDKANKLTDQIKRERTETGKAIDVATREIATLRKEIDRLSSSESGPYPAEIDERLAKLACVPLGMRVAGLVLDVLFLALASATLRFGPEWGGTLPERQTFIVAMFAVFSLRAFFSPGNLLLGISARHIGPDLRPEGRAGFKARLVCGLLHYGPLVATAYLAVWDEGTREGLDHLVAWASDPGTSKRNLSAVVNELLRPSKPGLPGVILATTLVWWSLLLLSIVFSPLIHRGVPYFRNTTLVEWMSRVGFLRFSPPVLEVNV